MVTLAHCWVPDHTGSGSSDLNGMNSGISGNYGCSHPPWACHLFIYIPFLTWLSTKEMVVFPLWQWSVSLFSFLGWHVSSIVLLLSHVSSLSFWMAHLSSQSAPTICCYLGNHSSLLHRARRTNVVNSFAWNHWTFCCIRSNDLFVRSFCCYRVQWRLLY